MAVAGHGSLWHPLIPRAATLVDLVFQEQRGDLQAHLGGEVGQRVLHHRHQFLPVQDQLNRPIPPQPASFAAASWKPCQQLPRFVYLFLMAVSPFLVESGPGYTART